MLYRNIFLLEVILVATLATCNQNSISPKGTVHHKPSVSKKSSTLTKKIGQKELELNQTRQALERFQTQRMNLSQHEDDVFIQPPPEIKRTSRGKHQSQHAPERIDGGEGESIDGCDGSVASSFREVENVLDSSVEEILLEEILEKGAGSPPSKMPTEVLQDDEKRREALQAKEDTLSKRIKQLEKDLNILRAKQQ